MMRLLRPSVFVALLLLTSAATAYAECAWLLRSQVVLRQTGQILAFPMRCFDTHQACERELFAAAKQREAENPESRIVRLCSRHRGPARAEGEVVSGVEDVDVASTSG
jgi:hypothetical protein